MPLSPAGSKHESPESPPPEPPPPPERQPRAAAAGEPGAGLREETRLDPARGPGGPRSPKLAAPARMEEPAPGAIVVRIGIPDLQQTVTGSLVSPSWRAARILDPFPALASGP
ncbi:SH3 and multiple ankyrin repeat domains protein 3 [Grus japonensis]|uniref:SH3 and multiple ankyrin repeat domains protein 3 n=1 Tax=Grus japonensis TaxID=30415 RepID=A0ABC9VQD1_GRUJA